MDKSLSDVKTSFYYFWYNEPTKESHGWESRLMFGWVSIHISSWNRFWLKTDSPAGPEKAWRSLAQRPGISVGRFSKGQGVLEDNPGSSLLARMSSEIVIWNRALSFLEKTQSHRSASEWVWSQARGTAEVKGKLFKVFLYSEMLPHLLHPRQSLASGRKV